LLDLLLNLSGVDRPCSIQWLLDVFFNYQGNKRTHYLLERLWPLPTTCSQTIHRKNVHKLRADRDI
jgi:hypothetical protein